MLFLVALLTGACSAQPPANPAVWESPLRQDHGLVGRIWDSRLQRFVTPGELLDGLREARFLLLGEKHDNADHHRLQLAVLESLISAQALSGVAFEMIDASRAGKLEGITGREFADAAALKSWLEWDDGWNWDYYSPLLLAALAADLPLAAANINESAVMEIYRGNGPALPENVYDVEAMDKFHADIDESHCGLLPESQFPAMVRVQHSRDLAMARAMSDLAGDSRAALLIAGNYHARHDLGMPNYLLALEPDLRRGQIISLSFVEVQLNETVPVTYLERFGGIADHDYLWFTPAAEDQDYCAELRLVNAWPRDLTRQSQAAAPVARGACVGTRHGRIPENTAFRGKIPSGVITTGVGRD